MRVNLDAISEVGAAHAMRSSEGIGYHDTLPDDAIALVAFIAKAICERLEDQTAAIRDLAKAVRGED